MATNPTTTTLTRGGRDERETAQRPLDLKLVTRLWRYTRPYAKSRNRLLVLVVIRSLQLPAIIALFGVVIDGPITDRNWPQTLWMTGGFAALVLSMVVVLYLRMRMSMRLGEAVIHDLRNDIFAHLQRLSIRYFDQTKIGRVIARITSDAEAVRRGVEDVLFVTMVRVGQMAGAAAFMIWSDAWLFVLILLLVPGTVAIVGHFRVGLSDARRSVQESFSWVTATLAESVGGIRVTQGFARQDVNAKIFEQLVSDHADNHVTADCKAGLFEGLLELQQQLFYGAMIVTGGYLVFHAGSSVGDLIRYFFLANLFFSPIAMIGRQYNQALTAMAGAERVFELLDTPPHFDEPPESEPAAASGLTGRVEFRHVNFHYEPGSPVLRDVCFTAEPGQTVALVGQTGGGKSTLISLIAKFYLTTGGQILIDGQEIRQINGSVLRKRMGIVLQDNFLFTGTVADNIRLGRPDARDTEVLQAAARLGCADLIDRLPDGFETQVGERGAGLSLGQRQIICFARAMLADPRYLILDEATSSVDTMTENRIQEALAKLLSGRTSFVVAHRLSTIRHADQVLVVDQGQILERGTHEDLLVRGGIYANLYLQFIRTNEAC